MYVQSLFVIVTLMAYMITQTGTSNELRSLFISVHTLSLSHSQVTSDNSERVGKISDAMKKNNPTSILFVILSLSIPIRSALVESGLPRTRNEVKRIYIH